jgi:hypothetical protein
MQEIKLLEMPKSMKILLNHYRQLLKTCFIRIAGVPPAQVLLAKNANIAVETTAILP